MHALAGEQSSGSKGSNELTIMKLQPLLLATMNSETKLSVAVEKKWAKM